MCKVCDHNVLNCTLQRTPIEVNFENVRKVDEIHNEQDQQFSFFLIFFFGARQRIRTLFLSLLVLFKFSISYSMPLPVAAKHPTYSLLEKIRIIRGKKKKPTSELFFCSCYFDTHKCTSIWTAFVWDAMQVEP